MRYGTMLAGLIAMAGLCVGGETPEDSLRPLIQALHDESQSKREVAATALSRLGLKAVGPVTEVAAGRDSEAMILAISVLERLNESKDIEVQQAAERALEKLIAEGPASAGQRALEAWNRQTEGRRTRAIAYLEKHKAKIWLQSGLEGLSGEEDGTLPHTLIIGAEFTGGDDSVRQITAVDSLVNLYLTTGQPLSEAAIERLKKARPQLRIDKRGRAFLGVGHNHGPFGITVGSVADGTPAHKGGLLPHDTIIEFAGFPTGAPDDLINAIAKCNPGDEVKVVILRDPNNRFAPGRFRQFSMNQIALFELLNAAEPENVLLPIALFHSMRMELTVTLGEWQPSR